MLALPTLSILQETKPNSFTLSSQSKTLVSFAPVTFLVLITIRKSPTTTSENLLNVTVPWTGYSYFLLAFAVLSDCDA